MEYYDLPKNAAFLVSLKAIILDKNGRFLMLQCPRGTSPWSERWGFPGGLVEFNEPFDQALAREIKEETSLKVAISDPFAAGSYEYSGFKFRDGRVLDIRFVGIAYKCKLMKGSVVLSEEHINYRWLSWKEASFLDITPDSKFVFDSVDCGIK